MIKLRVMILRADAVDLEELDRRWISFKSDCMG
jgi:hypothetical protein